MICYLDTSVFIAWLKNEDHGDGVQERIEEILDGATKGQIKIVTSVITRVEMMRTFFTKEQQQHFDALLLGSKSAYYADVNPKIAELAETIRSDSKNKHDKTPSTPDAIHVATAIHLKCDVLYTLDQGGKDNKRGLGMTKIDSSVLGGLKIERPISLNRKLPGMS